MRTLTKQDIEDIVTRADNTKRGAQQHIKNLYNDITQQNNLLQQARGELERIYRYLEAVYRNNRDNQELYDIGKRCEFALETMIKYGQVNGEQLLGLFEQFFKDNWVLVNIDAWRSLSTDAE